MTALLWTCQIPSPLVHLRWSLEVYLIAAQELGDQFESWQIAKGCLLDNSIKSRSIILYSRAVLSLQLSAPTFNE